MNTNRLIIKSNNRTPNDYNDNNGYNENDDQYCADLCF